MVKSTMKEVPIIELERGYKPSEQEEYMNSKQLEYFRRKLLQWRQELSHDSNHTLEHLRSENWQEPDIGDAANIEIEASLELRTRDRYRKLINKIDAALQRIDNGSYGYCEETGEEIGLRRLDARPIATLSVEAQERHERYEKTHWDEDKDNR